MRARRIFEAFTYKVYFVPVCTTRVGALFIPYAETNSRLSSTFTTSNGISASFRNAFAILQFGQVAVVKRSNLSSSVKSDSAFASFDITC